VSETVSVHAPAATEVTVIIEPLTAAVKMLLVQPVGERVKLPV